VHDPSYVAMLDRAASSGGGYLDADTYITPLSMVAPAPGRCRRRGVQRVGWKGATRTGVGGRAGHHASTRSDGFCLLNNIAIASSRPVTGGFADRGPRLRRPSRQRHAAQFENDSEVFYASTHQYPFYPAREAPRAWGACNVLNVPLAAAPPSGVPRRVGKRIGPALDAFKPELLLVSAVSMRTRTTHCRVAGRPRLSRAHPMITPGR